MSFRKLIKNGPASPAGGLFWLGVITLLAFAIRAWGLSEPSQYVFDEVYYAKYAGQYLRGEQVFDAHPPGGRLILTLGSLVVGDGPIGWRAVPLLFGTALIPLSYFVAVLLFGSKRAGLIAALLVAFDGFFFVYSRTSLLEILLVFFVQLGLLAALVARQSKNSRNANFWWLAAAAALGMAVSVKWIGLGLLPLLVGLAVTNKTSLRSKATAFATLIVVPVIIYGAFFFFDPSNQPVIWQDVKHWHTHTWRYHRDLTETRSYNAAWWQWPLLTKPILFHHEQAGKQVKTIIALGNPAVWWGSSLAVFAGLITVTWRLISHLRRKTRGLKLPSGLIIALASYLAFLLPWALVKRGLFIFHYLTAYLFAILVLSFWISKLIKRPDTKAFAIGCLVATAAVFWYFYPLLTATQIPLESFQARLWLGSWLLP